MVNTVRKLPVGNTNHSRKNFLNLETFCLNVGSFFLIFYKKIIFVILCLSIQSSFSNEENGGLPDKIVGETGASEEARAEAKTEAGSVCLEKDCPSGETSFEALQGTVNDQVCKATQSKKECKGVDKRLLKGCYPGGGLKRAGESALQCPLGFVDGVGSVFEFVYDWIKSLGNFEGMEPGVKAYLHAEIESESQNSGSKKNYAVISSALTASGISIGMLYESIGDMYTCLNGIGITQKTCKFISSIASFGVLGAGVGAVVGGWYAVFPIAAFLVTGGSKMAILSAAGTAALAGAMGGGAIGGITGMITGPANAHDRGVVEERIRERMRDKVKEFKDQEESTPN